MKRCVKSYISKRFPTGTIDNFDTADKMKELDIIDVEKIIGELETDAIKIHKTAVQKISYLQISSKVKIEKNSQ